MTLLGKKAGCREEKVLRVTSTEKDAHEESHMEPPILVLRQCHEALCRREERNTFQPLALSLWHRDNVSRTVQARQS